MIQLESCSRTSFLSTIIRNLLLFTLKLFTDRLYLFVLVPHCSSAQKTLLFPLVLMLHMYLQAEKKKLKSNWKGKSFFSDSLKFGEALSVTAFTIFFQILKQLLNSFTYFLISNFNTHLTQGSCLLKVREANLFLLIIQNHFSFKS